MLFFIKEAAAQPHIFHVPKQHGDSTHLKISQPYLYDINNQLDMIDIAKEMVNSKATKRIDTGKEIYRTQVSALPAAGYTLQTGFAVIAFGNVVFFTHKDAEEKVSNITANVTYTQYSQWIIPMQSNIWTKNNKYNITSDWRYVNFPSLTYGLGMHNTLNDGYYIDYSAFRFHNTIYRDIARNFYVGAGYQLDYFWNVQEIDPPLGKKTDYQSYGLKQTETASGIALNVLYDSRQNSVNADNGIYSLLTYSYNPTFLGSTTNTQSLILDVRKYFKFPASSNNVLALWTYDWFTLAGNPPYLLLPNTGGDPASNSGRGYIQGRYRGKNSLYLESEYRFDITRNGLFGGVVFANMQSVTEPITNRFDVVAPGYGVGLRLKLNKFSKTNVGVDYGFGLGGSKGFFVNLGEVF